LIKSNCKLSDKLIPNPGSGLMLPMQTEESDYFRVIISEDKNFDASKGNILEIIIEAPLKPRPRRRSDTHIPLIRLATRLMLERGLGASSWSEKHVDVRPIKLSELPARGEPVAREGNLSASIMSGP
jgi:hypothetical protein